MDDDGGFNDPVTGIVDHDVAHGELWAWSLFLRFAVCDAQPLRMLGKRLIDVLGDVSRELNGFTQAMNAFDDSSDETGCELAGVR